MSSVNSTRSQDQYEMDRALAKESHERDLMKVKDDSEEELTTAKREYQERLQQIKKEATEEIRKLKEDSYDQYGRKFSDVERDHLNEREHITQSYESELSRANRNLKEQRQQHLNRVDEVLHQANDTMEKRLDLQKSEYNRAARESELEKRMLLSAYENEMLSQSRRNQQGNKKIIDLSNENMDRALKEQGRRYEDHLNQKEQVSRQQIGDRDAEITRLKTSSDVRDIPIQARNKIEAYYQQQMAEDSEKNRQLRDATVFSVREQGLNEKAALQENHQKKLDQVNREVKSKLNGDLNRFANDYQQLAQRSELNQRNMEEKFAKNSERTYRTNALQVAGQEEKNIEQHKNLRLSHQDELNRLKQDHRNHEQEMRRNFSFQMSDVRREFDRKLELLEEDHENQVARMKIEHDKKLQDQDRESKRLMNDRVRAYEAQLKQQEAIHREQRKVLTEHYEEELDKVNRSHARLTKAKS